MSQITQQLKRPVPGYEDLYEVSTEGLLYRTAPGQGTKTGPVKGYKNSWGYLVVTLCKDGVRRKFILHRLVCLTFLGPAGGLQVNHKNGVKTDNRLENLEYVTQSENAYHKTRTLGKCSGEAHYAYGRVGPESHSARGYAVISPSGAREHIKGLAEFCRSNGLTHSAMVRVAQGTQSTHKGWGCQYAD